MPPLVSRSNSFLDSDNGSADKNYFTFRDDDVSVDESSATVEAHDDDNESVYSVTAAAVIKNIEGINQCNMKARKQRPIQMKTFVYPHNKQDLQCSIWKPINIRGIHSKSYAAMIKYRRTFGGMIRTNIKLICGRAPSGIYTLQSF